MFNNWKEELGQGILSLLEYSTCQASGNTYIIF